MATGLKSQLKDQMFHFIGVGGIGVCGLAEILHNMGAKVSGSDVQDNANTERLRRMGIQIFIGHKAENLGPCDVVVYSSAISKNNPEIMAARARSIPLIQRGEALAELMRLKRGIAVGGTHGKTTTTSLLGSILMHGNTNPTLYVGGRIDTLNSTVKLGDGDWMVAEADESDNSFNRLSPEIVIITNIDSDHLDYFKSMENLKQAFLSFASRIPFYGVAIVCGDDPAVREIFSGFQKRVLFYGFSPENDVQVRGAKGDYEYFENGQSLGRFKLSVPGTHNALNATAAITAALKSGLRFEHVGKGLLEYKGVDRRFQLKGRVRDIEIYDDYAHHPTEVRATLQAFREKFPDRRIVILFQPHRFSRTEMCWNDFLTAFSLADNVLITDIYAAGENPITGVSSDRLVKEIQHKNVSYFPRGDFPQNLAESVQKVLHAGDVFVTMGAGDGWKIGMQLLETLK